MKSLLNVTEVWRVDTVEEALAMREEMSQAAEYDMPTFSYTTKFDKKEEIEYQVVKVKKIINLEKEPVSSIVVKYEI